MVYLEHQEPFASLVNVVEQALHTALGKGWSSYRAVHTQKHISLGCEGAVDHQSLTSEHESKALVTVQPCTSRVQSPYTCWCE